MDLVKLHHVLCTLTPTELRVLVYARRVQPLQRQVHASAVLHSTGADQLCVCAVNDACRQILKRLEPVRAKLAPGHTWKELVNAAYFSRIDLSAHGWFITDHVDGAHKHTPCICLQLF